VKGKGEADSCSSSRGAMDHACISPLKMFQKSPIHICTTMKNAREKFQVLPKALDLFTGTGSVANRLRELGYHVTTLDIRPSCDPNICVDILTWRCWRFCHPETLRLLVQVSLVLNTSLLKQKAFEILGGLIGWLKRHLKSSTIFSRHIGGLKIHGPGT